MTCELRLVRMSIISCALVLFSLLLFAPKWIDRAEAHWLGTHEKMLERAVDILATSPPQGNSWTEFVALLEEHERYLIEGVRDADLRANGIYAIDCGCEDPNEGWAACPDGECPPRNLGPDVECCPKSKLRCNEIADISQFIVGDHGYNPGTGEGAYVSGGEACIRVDEILEGYEKNPHPCESRAAKLWKKLAGVDADAKKASLRNEMGKSNAAVLADFFYDRALETWCVYQKSRKEKYVVDAMYNLGMAVHMVQDVSNPEHTRLKAGEENPLVSQLTCGGAPYATDRGYEGWVWECYLKQGDETNPWFPTRDMYAMEGDYSILDAKQWVEKTADTTYSWGTSALDPTLLMKSGESSGAASFRLGVNSSVGMLVSFFDHNCKQTAIVFGRTIFAVSGMPGALSGKPNLNWKPPKPTPVANVVLYFLHLDYENGHELFSTVSDNNGHYEITLPPGEYLLESISKRQTNWRRKIEAAGDDKDALIRTIFPSFQPKKAMPFKFQIGRKMKVEAGQRYEKDIIAEQMMVD